jgi:hypothetical protein
MARPLRPIPERIDGFIETCAKDPGMIDLLVDAETDAELLAEMARRYLRERSAELRRARTLEAEREASRLRTDRLARRELGLPLDAPDEEVQKRKAEREAEYRRETARIDYECKARLNESLGDILREYTTRLRMEWTSELLASEITLPDGTVTTWGDATVEEHEQRRQMFMKMAATNVEGAARHEQAIRALREGGATNLRALVGDGLRD